MSEPNEQTALVKISGEGNPLVQFQGDGACFELATVFRDKAGIDPLLEKITAEVKAFKADPSTAKGREAIGSMGHKIARSKTALDEVGAGLIEEAQSKVKAVNAVRKHMRDSLDKLKAEVLAPRDAWEQQETDRVAGLDKRVADIAALGAVESSWTSAKLNERLKQIDAIAVDDSFQEYAHIATEAKEAALRQVAAAMDIAERREAEEAELTRRKAELDRQEQEAAERRMAEQARLDAERKAENERRAIEAREQARVDAIKKRIEEIKQLGMVGGLSIDALIDRSDRLAQSVEILNLGEFVAEGEAVRVETKRIVDNAIEAIEKAEAAKAAIEAEAAEIKRQQKIIEERTAALAEQERQQREAKERAEAEAKLKAETEERLKREADARNERVKAIAEELRRLGEARELTHAAACERMTTLDMYRFVDVGEFESMLRAARDKALAAVKERLDFLDAELERQTREANEKHRAEVHCLIEGAMIDHIQGDAAMRLIEAIAAGKVPHVKIEY